VLRDLPEEDENLDSAATSASRAIELWRSFKKMTDIGLLAEPIFILFAISNFFTSIGFNAPPMFMPMNAEVVLGFSKDDSSTTVSAYGFANTIGRILFGLICDLRLPFKYGKDTARNRLWIYNLMLIFNGITTSFVYQMESYFTYVTYCFIFGLTISSYVCLTSVVLVDLIGIDRLTNGLGLLFFVQGVATFVGPPIAGKLFDYTRRYDWTFAFCGICLFISGAILYAIPIFFAGKQHYELASKNDRLEDKEFNADTPMLVKSEP
jgi:MFS family permease